MLGTVVLIAIGLFGGWTAWRALQEGEISVVWSTLGGWGRLTSAHERAKSPVVFWSATLFYGGGGLLLTALGLYRLLAHHG
jgi:hypothetical protein